MVTFAPMLLDRVIRQRALPSGHAGPAAGALPGHFLRTAKPGTRLPQWRRAAGLFFIADESPLHRKLGPYEVRNED